MKKKSLISVVSEQNGNTEESIEVVTPGDFYKKDEFYYAVYKETQITGMQDTTTTIKISPDQFSLIRAGSTTTRMNFKAENDEVALYDTPYGTLELKIRTKALKIDINEYGGDISVNYDMSIGGQKTQNTSLKINIKAQDE